MNNSCYSCGNDLKTIRCKKIGIGKDLYSMPIRKCINEKCLRFEAL